MTIRCSNCDVGWQNCSACGGTGRKRARTLFIFQKEIDCLYCRGLGRRKCPSCTGGELLAKCPDCATGTKKMECRECGGTKRAKCILCEGTGVVGVTERLSRLPITSQDELPRYNPNRCTVGSVPFEYRSLSGQELVDVLAGIGAKNYVGYEVPDEGGRTLNLRSSSDQNRGTWNQVTVYRVATNSYWAFRATMQEHYGGDWDYWEFEVHSGTFIVDRH